MATLDNYKWGDKLDQDVRERLLKETREALDSDPGNPGTSADVLDSISDADLYLKWLRA